ncbi:hypothetical protein GYMLUDRAFT_248301 [Collybiopsis luxurians FD-317 M1]|uniref:Uncharacterized protein n=1 Tax=Collybiopsis luxurians FD-317 M1 TaxID=944289 RepID=A0A0D0CCX6_9AGAR|nr:hypothetical protein GYMLUDRAFT_248301 [Collybiopsis luxurians FD-317 M1]
MGDIYSITAGKKYVWKAQKPSFSDRPAHLLELARVKVSAQNNPPPQGGEEEEEEDGEWVRISQTEFDEEDEWDGINGNNNEDKGEGDQWGHGPLPKWAQDELNAVQAEKHEKVVQIAKKLGRSIQSCYWYLRDDGPHESRALSYYNAWQVWYNMCGDQQRPADMPISQWSKVKLPEDQFHQRDARREALKEQLDWYNDNLASYINEKKKKGNFCINGESIYRKMGLHLGGYILCTERDAKGASATATWVSTPELAQIKERKGTQMYAQAADLEAFLRVQMILMQELDNDLQEVYTKATKEGSASRNHLCGVFLPLFMYLAGRLLEESDPKITFTQFSDLAWKLGLRIENWPVRVPFFEWGVEGKKGWCKGVQQVHDYSGDNLTALCSAHFSWWLDDERALALKEQGRLPLVVDTAGNTIVAVAHSNAYHSELQSSVEDPSDGGSGEDNEAGSNQPDHPVNGKQPLPLYEDDDIDENERVAAKSLPLHSGQPKPTSKTARRGPGPWRPPSSSPAPPAPPSNKTARRGPVPLRPLPSSPAPPALPSEKTVRRGPGPWRPLPPTPPSDETTSNPGPWKPPSLLPALSASRN